MVPRYPQTQFINLDQLTYAADLTRLQGICGCPNYSFLQGDIADETTVVKIMKEGVDAIVNFAAHSHVDRSIISPRDFIDTNICGCFILLEAARHSKIKRFLQISTDEVYGSLGKKGFFSEESPLAPNNPYSAGKAAADCLTRSYYKTYGLPALITRSTNNYGPYQHREKFIPTIIHNALCDELVPLYGDGRQIRDWIYVEDHCRALEQVLLRGKPGRIYNIGANEERTNLELAGSILHILGKSPSLLRFIDDRPGHDRRYALATGRIRKELGWRPHFDLETALSRTVAWYVQKFQAAATKE
jgi:dTDP-glucose 4,6-dehydratase